MATPILEQHGTMQIEELETVLAELKATQQQIVQNEKMAMVGKLTAGVAHEINNPLGFISSNVVSLGKYCERLLTIIELLHEILTSEKPDSQRGEQVLAVRHRLNIERIIREIPEMIRETMEGVLLTSHSDRLMVAGEFIPRKWWQ